MNIIEAIAEEVKDVKEMTARASQLRREIAACQGARPYLKNAISARLNESRIARFIDELETIDLYLALVDRLGVEHIAHSTVMEASN